MLPNKQALVYIMGGAGEAGEEEVGIMSGSFFFVLPVSLLLCEWD